MSLKAESGTPLTPLKLGYRPALDGVRALAITLVVVRHATGYPATGELGVDVFFVLSGFLITSLLLDERARTGAVSLSGFYRRRALRLLPALAVLLTCFLGLSLFAYVQHGASLTRPFFGIAAALGYFTNVAVTTGGADLVPPAMTHLWSLAAEEQFYVVWPVLLVVVLRARPLLSVAVLASGIALMTAEQLRLFFAGAPWTRMGYGVDTRTTSILVGCLLAVLLASKARSRVEAIGRRFGLLGVAYLLVLVSLDLERGLFVGTLLVVGLASAGLILVALDDESRVSRGLALAPVAFLGRISYSLYLWHVPVLAAFGVTHPELTPMVVPAIAAAVGCAAASYYLVEKPFLRRKERLASRPSRPLTSVARPADTHRLTPEPSAEAIASAAA